MTRIEKQLASYMEYGKNVQNLTPLTLRHRYYAIKKFSKDTQIKRIESVSNKTIDNWVSTMLGAGRKATTINGYLRFIVAMMRFFEERGVIAKNLNLKLVKMVKVEPSKKVFFTEEQINQVLAISDDFQWLLISLCFRCGFRLSEITNLKLSNFDGRRVTFVGKGRKDREVWISEEIRVRLDQWIEERGVTDWVWESTQRPGSPYSTQWIRVTMRKAFRKAGLSGFHPHALRHSFATNICSHGAPLPVAQKMLGHARITTTEIYVHSFDGKLEQFFEQYSLA